MDQHDGFDERLSQLLEGELTDDEAAALEAELAADADKAMERDAMAAMLADLQGLGEVQAPAGLADRVLAAVASEPLPTAEPAIQPAANDRPDNVVSIAAWRKVVPFAAAALVLLSLGVLSTQQGGESEPPAVAVLKPAAESGPAPTGADPSYDAVADAGEELEALRDRLESEAAARDDLATGAELLGTPSPAVAVGQVPASPRPARRAAPKPEPEPEGVFVAEFEREGEAEDAVAALDEEAAEEAPADEAPAEEARAAAPARSRAAAPPVASGFSAGGTTSLEEVSFHAAESAARGVLVLPNADAVRKLEAGIRSRGWRLQRSGNTPERAAGEAQWVLDVPASDADELQQALSGAGRYMAGGKPAVSGERARLNLRVRWGD